jgi:hypothetical protein
VAGAHYPDRFAHFFSLIQQMNGGKDNASNFPRRMCGQGCCGHHSQARAGGDAESEDASGVVYGVGYLAVRAAEDRVTWRISAN